jgi:hypothetical protein
MASSLQARSVRSDRIRHTEVNDMKNGIILTAAAGLTLIAAGVRAVGLEDGYQAAQAVIAAAPKAPVCWARAEDREADEIGLPTMLCFSAGQKGFTAKPKEVFTNSYNEGTCSESIWGKVQISAQADGSLKIVGSIESTNDNCHSAPQSRVVEYVKR